MFISQLTKEGLVTCWENIWSQSHLVECSMHVGQLSKWYFEN